MLELLAMVIYPDAFIRMAAVEEEGLVPQEYNEYVAPEPPTPMEQVVQPQRNVWDRLAECESGNWLNGGSSFEEGSARWGWGGSDPVPPWGTTVHHGGLQFHPSTWNWVAPMVGLGHIQFAYEATREEQILVAERVLALQGWQAWPVCSQRLNLR